MKMQKHNLKLHQKHAKPTDRDITLTQKPCWLIEAFRKKLYVVLVGHQQYHIEGGGNCV